MFGYLDLFLSPPVFFWVGEQGGNLDQISLIVGTWKALQQPDSIILCSELPVGFTLKTTTGEVDLPNCRLIWDHFQDSNWTNGFLG